LAFVHIPKTAGTSITSILRDCYGALSLPAMTTLDYPFYSTEELEKYRFYSGHAYLRDYQRLPHDTVRFTVLRDPTERALSFYHYCRTRDLSQTDDPFAREVITLANEASAIEFFVSDLPMVVEHIRMGQLRQFLPEATLHAVGHRLTLPSELRTLATEQANAELQQFDYVLTSECLNLSFPLMARALGLPRSCARLNRENTSPDSIRNYCTYRHVITDLAAEGFEIYARFRRREQNWIERMLEDPPNRRHPVLHEPEAARFS